LAGQNKIPPSRARTRNARVHLHQKSSGPCKLVIDSPDASVRDALIDTVRAMLDEGESPSVDFKRWRKSGN
jgi:hypothetical protein